MLHWFADLMNVTDEITIHRPNVSTLLSSIFMLYDIISAVSGNEAERLLSHLNSVEPSIQFTLEREKDRHFPFLDLNVFRVIWRQVFTVNLPTPTNTSLSILTTLFSIKSL